MNVNEGFRYMSQSPARGSEMQDLVAIEGRPTQYIDRLHELLGKLVRLSEAEGGPSLDHLPASPE